MIYLIEPSCILDKSSNASSSTCSLVALRDPLDAEPLSRLTARKVPASSLGIFLYHIRVWERLFKLRLKLRAAELELDNVTLLPAEKGARRKHPKVVITHLVVRDNLAAASGGERRVKPIPVVIVAARRAHLGGGVRGGVVRV